MRPMPAPQSTARLILLQLDVSPEDAGAFPEEEVELFVAVDVDVDVVDARDSRLTLAMKFFEPCRSMRLT